jgi:hypothetical protein
MPRTRVGSGSGSERCTATASALLAVGQHIPNFLETSEMDRFDSAIECADFSRNRHVNRDRVVMARLVWVNDLAGKKLQHI